MRRVLTARRVSARHDALRRALSEHAPATLIARRARAAAEVVRSAPPPCAFLGVERFSWRGWILQLALPVLAREGLVPLEPLAREALAARALARAEPRLSAWGPVLDTPGLARAAGRTLDELRRFGLAPGALETTGPELPALLTAYEGLLQDGQLADDSRIMAAAREAIATSGSQPVFLLDVVPSDPCEAEFLSTLASHHPVTAVVSPGTPGLAAWARQWGATLEALDEAEPATDSLDRARRNIFAPEVTEDAALDVSLRLGSSSQAATEARAFARRALEHAADGFAFDRMAILLREPEVYTPLLQDAFRRAQVPLRLARAAQRPAPAGRALLALLACAEEDLSAERFAEYLSFGETPTPAPNGAPPVREVPWVPAADDGRQLVFFSLEPEVAEAPPPPLPEPGTEAVVDGRLKTPLRWEKLIVEASVVGGLERWVRRLRGLRAELETKRAALDDAPAAQLVRDLDALTHLERFALPVMTQLSKLPETASWAVWVDELEALATASLRKPEPVLQALAELRALDELGAVHLSEVQLVLRERLGFLREERPLDEDPGVWVGPVEDAEGACFDIVFVPGLAGGSFPKKSFEDPLLLDGARARLHPDLPRRARLAEQERARLRVALECAEVALEASFPRLDADRNRPRVPSFYAMDLIRAATGRLPPLAELEHRAAAETAVRAGWEVPSEPERAADATEYDLSILAEALAKDELRGAGRYLVEGRATPHPHLVRALRARAARWRSAVGKHDGLVVDATSPSVDDSTRAALNEARLSRRTYSATSLQHHAACPYRFYLSSILRLRPREEVLRIEQLDPLLRGQIVHSVLFRWFERVRDEDLLPAEAEDLPALLDHLDDAVARVGRQYEERLAPALPRVWRQELDELRRDLRAHLRHEMKSELGFHPAHAELSFGLTARDEQDPASWPTPVDVEGVKIRGAIDLVERRLHDGRLRITDYKTGRARPEPEHALDRGHTLQPILYALAAEAIFGAEVEAARLAYCTRRGGFSTPHFPVGPKARALLRRLLSHIEGEVAGGRLAALPEPQACRYCDFVPVCGTEEIARAGRKDPAARARLRIFSEDPHE